MNLQALDHLRNSLLDQVRVMLPDNYGMFAAVKSSIARRCFIVQLRVWHKPEATIVPLGEPWEVPFNHAAALDADDLELLQSRIDTAVKLSKLL